MPKRTRSDSSTRIRQILEAARDILTTGGLESLKIAALADIVGLSEAAIYRHVDSKEEILMLVVNDVRNTLFRGIDSANSPNDKPALRKLEHLLHQHLTWLDGRHGACLMLVTEALQFGDGKANCESRKLMNDYTQSVTSIIEEGQRNGEINQGLDAETAATMFIGVEKAAVNRWLFYPNEKRPKCQSDDLWRMYKTSISSAPVPATSG